MSRDAAEFHEASYESDPSQQCDALEDHVSELLRDRLKRMPAEKELKAMVRLMTSVYLQLLKEGRTGALVEVKHLTHRELLARLIGEIIEAPQPVLMACAVDFVFSLGVLPGKKMTGIAQEHGVTKATVSRYCRHLSQLFLGGHPAPGMKSVAAVTSYRNSRIGKSSRPPRVEWVFGKILTDTFHGDEQPTPHKHAA